MNLLKAICKTMLSALKFIVISSIIVGVIVAIANIPKYPVVGATLAIIMVMFLLGCLVAEIIFVIVMLTKENYEKIMRKSKNPNILYKINYNIIYERDRTSIGKTKEQAVDNLYTEILKEGSGDCKYKIVKVTEIK